MSDPVWFDADVLNCVTELAGDTRGFRRRVERMDGVDVICTMFQARWHGFARYTVERRLDRSDGTTLVERLEEGWVRRRRRAPFYEFGPTRVEIHGDVLVDNRRMGGTEGGK